MPYGTTTTLTPELAIEIIILRSEGKSYNEIVRKLRADGLTVNAPDITHWKQQHESVELYGESRDFFDMMAEANDAMCDEAAAEMVLIADTAQKGKEPDHITKHRLNARRWAWSMRAGHHVHLSGEVKGGGTVRLVVPESELFRDDREDG